MIKRPALAIALGLTTFILTIAAVLFYQVQTSTTVVSATTGQPAEATNQPASPASAVAPAENISPDQAVTAALKATPGGQLLRAPELVNYMGIVAYEVPLSTGMVYVDSNTGRVLSNRAIVPQYAERQQPKKHGESDEHKSTGSPVFGSGSHTEEHDSD